MNDNYSHHRNSAACYQLVQSVLKMDSVLAESVGQEKVGGCMAAVAFGYRKGLVSAGWPVPIKLNNCHVDGNWHAPEKQ